MTSLRRQLTRWLVGALAALVGAALVAIYGTVWHDLVEAFDATLRSDAIAVGAQIEQADGQVTFEFTPEFLRGYRADKSRHFFEVWDRNLKPLARSPSLGERDLQSARGIDETKAVFQNYRTAAGRRVRAINYEFAPRLSGGQPGPEKVLVAVASDREELDETLGGLFAAVAGIGVILFVAVWFVVPQVLRRGLRPLDELSENVARLDSDTLSASLPVANLPVELRPIGDRLNDLLARLAASFERERRFSADLAHELRTPLAELRSLAECALKWPETRDAATDRDVLAVATQMEALVTRMLALARSERGQLGTEMAPVDMAALATETWRPFAARAESRRLRVTHVLAPGTARADAALLRAILANLFENAVAYTPAGGAVHISGEATTRGYALQCRNPAGDLTVDDVPRLFERFWRKETARSGAGEHVGLGLSLARALASAMRWRLDAALDDARQIVFTLESDA